MRRDPGPEHPEWSRRYRDARDGVIPWIGETVPLEDATVVEYGCGQGAVSCALSPFVKRLIGIDIDEEAIELARDRVYIRDIENVELRHVPVEQIVSDFRAIDERVDVVLLYAVVEHLTLDERMAVLEAAGEVVHPDGHIVVVEAPNRLTPVDHHTAYTAFFDALPDDLAIRYAHRTPRAEVTERIATAQGEGPGAPELALARLGRGVSHHEFELVFGDLAACTAASNYAVPLYPSRPVRWEELQLAISMDSWRPDLPPAWSRSWIDTILTPTPREARPPQVRPWRMRLDADVRGEHWVRDDGRIGLGDRVRLPVRLPVGTSEVHVGFTSEADPTDALRAHVGGETTVALAAGNRVGVPQWHAAVHVPDGTSELELSIDGGGELTFVGYAAACGAPTGEKTRAWGF